MVIRTRKHLKPRGVMIIELVVAMGILTVALLPLGYAASSTARRFRANYDRAVAMEIVDGEMEILAAGEWRGFPEGAQPTPFTPKPRPICRRENFNSPAPGTISAWSGPPPKSGASAPSSGR